MKFIILLLTVAVLFVAFRCFTVYVSDSSVHAGVVISRVHSASFVISTPVQIGKTLMIIPQYHPESWSITIRGVSASGQIRDRVISVGEKYFNEHKEGEQIIP